MQRSGLSQVLVFGHSKATLSWESESTMILWCRTVAEDRRFQMFILAVILFNALLMGLETSPSLMQAFGPWFGVLNTMVQAIFVVEITIRLLTYWPRPLAFFREGWNVFDFAIVALSLLPVAGPFATVSRLARLLRVTRVVSVSADLRLIIETMLRSIPSMGHVALLLFVLVYVYAIFGYYLFHGLDPNRWGSLGAALLSVFQLLTLEGWVEMQQTLLPTYPWAWLYFASFVIIGVFIVINLFIAVVLNNLETVRTEERRLGADHLGADHGDLLRRIEELRAQLDVFASELQRQQKNTEDRVVQR